jgi:exopolyphosphatase/guanosine-5'-triphosphate,3'-diphosphate pyrophosphatase
MSDEENRSEGIGMSEPADVADRRDRSVKRLMAECDFPQAHARQVRVLADRMADQLTQELVLGQDDRLILGYAALLHDVGWHFGQRKHHRRSYELITSGGLAGFAPLQIEMIALVARYHRKAVPKLSHQPFARLGAHDRQTVTKLAAILRVADGLDRGHQVAVRDVRVEIEPQQVRLLLTAAFGDMDAELWAADRKKKLLETVLGRAVHLTDSATQA